MPMVMQMSHLTEGKVMADRRLRPVKRQEVGKGSNCALSRPFFYSVLRKQETDGQETICQTAKLVALK